MGKSAVVEKDSLATPSTILFPGAVAGSWTAGPVQETQHTKLKAGGKALLSQAQCTFTFQGNGPPPANPPVSGRETVVLTPTAQLTKSQQAVLLDGDMMQGPFGNKLEAKASTQNLATG